MAAAWPSLISRSVLRTVLRTVQRSVQCSVQCASQRCAPRLHLTHRPSHPSCRRERRTVNGDWHAHQHQVRPVRGLRALTPKGAAAECNLAVSKYAITPSPDRAELARGGMPRARFLSVDPHVPGTPFCTRHLLLVGVTAVGIISGWLARLRRRPGRSGPCESSSEEHCPAGRSYTDGKLQEVACSVLTAMSLCADCSLKTGSRCSSESHSGAIDNEREPGNYSRIFPETPWLAELNNFRRTLLFYQRDNEAKEQASDVAVTQDVGETDE